MAVPVLTSAGAGDGGTGGTVAPGYPASIAAGDLLFLVVAIRNLSETATTPAGWSLVSGPVDTVGSVRGYLFKKVANGSESGTLTVTVSGSVERAARIYRVTGANSTESVATLADVGSVILDVGVTTTGADRLALNFIMSNGTTSGVGAFAGQTGGTWTKPIVSYEFSGTNNIQLDVDSADMASAGTIDGGSIDYTTPSQEVVIGLAAKSDVVFPSAYTPLPMRKVGR